MNRTFWRVIGGYTLWILLNVFIAVFEIGDAGVSSHLALLFTGFPASLPSLYFKHASLAGVLAAGALGLMQWAAIAWILRSRQD